MRLVDAGSLSRSNLAYREPAVYDELLAGSELTSDLMRAFVTRHDASARTVLDLGCGTARMLAELRLHGFTCTGIDLQPNLIGWAGQRRPGVRLQAGDLRTARLGTTFDLVTCVGNTLSYLHTDAELAAAFDTVRAHSHVGSLLALATLTGAGRDARSTSEITTPLGAATVTTTSTWDPTGDIQTTLRTGRFATGRVEHDTIRRRHWGLDHLTELADVAGFRAEPASPSLTLCAVRRR